MKKLDSSQMTTNSFDDLGRFEIDQFDHKPSFSSFLPGIAGLHGIPMWVFYVNRGQAVSSFGVENKDHPILEFEAANKAYRDVGLKGFRTFLNGKRGDKKWQGEFFSPWHAKKVHRKMFIGMNEVEIQEINLSLGYQVNILYVTLPNEPFSGLVRKLSIKNLFDEPLKLEVLDGLPGIVPFGVDNGALKHISRTIEAWMHVDNLQNKLPFYRLKATPGDTAEVHAIHAGNYAFAFHEGKLMPAIGDPSIIFGMDNGQSKAHLFHDKGLKKLLTSEQILEGRTLCAFFGVKINLEPGEEKAITSVYGYSEDLPTIQTRVDKILAPGYIDGKIVEARKLTEELTDDVSTASSDAAFDAYCRQTFLDNLLRGGYPLTIGGKHITHVFSRKHGDIERDYNFFVLPPEFYSQGNGNYRDVNQNRRSDVFFNPRAGESNIRLFMSLIQADGYNPLVINGLTFSLNENKVEHFLSFAKSKDRLSSLLHQKFTPGKLLQASLDADLSIPVDDFIEKVFAAAESNIEAEYGEGYWVDHWTYNLDLVEAYLAVFPDKKMDLLANSAPLPFFDSSHIVQPRQKRFVEFHGKPLQLNAVVQDQEKKALITSRFSEPNWARDNFGTGEIFRLPLLSKLTLLALIKFATLDPDGMGIQMEAGRPGWYDALNGLPGLFGSSMPETYELLRLIDFLIDVLNETSIEPLLPIEAQILVDAISETRGREADSFILWDEVTSALEAYRRVVRLGFDGKTMTIDIKPILQFMREKINLGVKKAQSFTGKVPPTYFIHEVTDYTLAGTEDINGNPYIRVKGFKPKALPAFLEGPVRLMKISDLEQARDLATAVKQSSLFDNKLGMYKVNAPLDDQPHEIGRARAFTPGWLENESIWMHMSFKYLLEMLKVGLYEEFFEALKAHLPAFMDPAVYGRSPLENSSFIVSSAHPDKKLHGRGFVARLSGSTAEFISMWVIMTAGKQPFRLENDQLVLSIKPALPGWLFTQDGAFNFRFLGSCVVRLHNPMRKDTYDVGMTVKKIELHSNQQTIELEGAAIKSPYAEMVREGKFETIDLFYG